MFCSSEQTFDQHLAQTYGALAPPPHKQIPVQCQSLPMPNYHCHMGRPESACSNSANPGRVCGAQHCQPEQAVPVVQSRLPTLALACPYATVGAHQVREKSVLSCWHMVLGCPPCTSSLLDLLSTQVECAGPLAGLTLQDSGFAMPYPSVPLLAF
jgi:hypothetical protein